MMHGEIGARHLTAEDVAAYADRGLVAAERARVEAHLAACAECRAEVVAVARLSRSFARRGRWAGMAPPSAAAVLVLFLARWPRPRGPGGAALREPAVTTAVAPTGIASRGGRGNLAPLTSA